MCWPLGPAIVAASVARSSDRATMPICCTNDSRPFFVASIASSSGSISCCIATLIVTGVFSCFRPVLAALFFMAAPLPLRALVLANLILRPARSRRYFTFSTRSGAFPRLETAVVRNADVGRERVKQALHSRSARVREDITTLEAGGSLRQARDKVRKAEGLLIAARGVDLSRTSVLFDIQRDAAIQRHVARQSSSATRNDNQGSVPVAGRHLLLGRLCVL